jgi:GxxExxY protein
MRESNTSDTSGGAVETTSIEDLLSAREGPCEFAQEVHGCPFNDKAAPDSLREIVFVFLGAAIEIYNLIGPGRSREGYLGKLVQCMTLSGIPLEVQPSIPLSRNGAIVSACCQPDLLVSGKIVAELTVTDRELRHSEIAKFTSLLKRTQIPVGYLFNYGSPNALEWRVFGLRTQSVHATDTEKIVPPRAAGMKWY